MRIKGFIGLLLICILYCVELSAQTNYYTTTKTLYQSGYTYQCDVVQESKKVTLYNKVNSLTYTEQMYKATGKLPPLLGNPPDVVDDNWTRQKCKQIVNSAFSATERQRVNGRDFGIFMYISPETGKVIEVRFTFTSTGNPFATIPVSVYRKIETDLKNNIWFTPTADGKKLNYICRFWRQEITTP
ncbi:DUF5043 domain-containing protein [Bacteroides sp. UBA939]|uniref:DUF5043 domain-containing protein n=1 Tax=Bacteroides sp. UBA939 TaxID=1946092 RepID=UPI0025C1950A|nr:DUF5043 domain-containing protein [Bacteroides sp. UBA939]